MKFGDLPVGCVFAIKDPPLRGTGRIFEKTAAGFYARHYAFEPRTRDEYPMANDQDIDYVIAPPIKDATE